MPDALPIVDLSSPREGDQAPLTRIAADVGAACRDVGFFYAVNHGVDAGLIAEAFAQSRRFFASPVAEKQALAIEEIGGNRGYSGLLHEALDPGRGPDMKEAFNVGLELAPDDPELMAGKPFRARNAWPNLPNFRETLLAYYAACSALGARLHRAFAQDLGLRPDFFADKFDRPMATLRLLRYPAAPQDSAPGIGAGAHTDYGNLTLLATGDVGGLEVRTRAGQWIAAPIVPGAFVVNIGDCLMRWTNDVYVSNSAPRGQSKRQRALFDRLFLRPKSGRNGRNNPRLCAARRTHALSANPGGGLSEAAPGREQAGGRRSVGRSTEPREARVVSRRGRRASHSALARRFVVAPQTETPLFKSNNSSLLGRPEGLRCGESGKS